MATVEGGYDYDFVEPPPEGLLCKICQLPCRDAQSSEGHVYCKRCISKTESSTSVDRDVKALKVYCPNKKDGCGWTGEIARVDDHVKVCKISCSKCKQIVHFSTMRSHLDTECPCYCPYCDITAEREVISSEHKEKCRKFPITCPDNITVDNGLQDKFDKTNNVNELQSEIFDKINEMFNPTILAELQKDISTIKEEVVLSIQIAKERSEKIDKQNDDEKQYDTTLMDQLCNIRSYLTIAVLIIAILAALLLRSPHGMSEDQMVEQLNSLQANISMIKTELHDISQSVLKLQGIQHNSSLFNERIEESIKVKLHETMEQLNSIQVKLEDNAYRHTQNITKLHHQIAITQEVLNETVENQLNNYHQLSSSIWSIKLLLSSDNTSNQVAPVIVKMPSFTKKLMEKEEWHSDPFFAFGGGYQMCLNVPAAGNGDGEGTHVSVFLHLMKGPHDDKLEQSGHWPLRGTFTIELLNQLNDSDHYSHMLQFHHHWCNKCTDRVLTGTEAAGLGKPQFISHDALDINGYHKNDFLIFRISYEDIEPPDQVAPVTFRVTCFSQWLKSSKDLWYSSPFFAFEEGYHMFLSVDAAGYGDGEGTYVSVYLTLMKGPHDDKLEQSGHWPLRGTFIIELLNQLNDSDHYSHMLQFHHHRCSECTNRVVSGTEATRWGNPQFISHDALLHHSDYYRSDSLIFRISYEYVEPPYQIAPVSFKVRHFSQHLKHKLEWNSSPFFAFSDGYLMSLMVHAAGNEGTHVSIYLTLMKGPLDDKLEQSGHWPLRGTFIIELLNQLNDSDHYSHIVQFHHHQCSECTNRVVSGTEATSWGNPQFISHDALLHHSDYYRSDSLIFRISYEYVEPPYQIAPVSFKVRHFSQHLKYKQEWNSSPFLAFSDGYLMSLMVHASGYDEGEGTHVSIYLILMKGPHDDKLEQSGHWPLRGTFTIELLNQLNDSDHYSHMLQFHHHRCSDCTDRVLEGVEADGWGEPQYISHDALFHHSKYSCDLLIFRVSYEDVEETPYQVTPVSFKITKFSQWLKNDREWYSVPFFAYERGYQMCLGIYAAGNGDGEGTHVSVYLYLMKGPHDDKLEQSGHWPLRGTFIIELLNQLNDSDHYRSLVMPNFTESINRVDPFTYNNISVMIKVIPQFISHDILLQHDGYLKNNVLSIQVSYFSK